MHKTYYKIKDILLVLLIIGIGIYLYTNDKKEDTIPKIEPTPREQFQITFIDVGEADSIIIQNKGKYALVDAGNNEDGDKIVSYMKELGIKELEYVFGTHAHEDHIGGMDNIIKAFEVKRYFSPNVITTTRTFEEILEELKKKNIKFETPKIGDVYSLEDTKMEIVWIGDNPEDINSNSIVMKVTYKNNTFLLTGDATTEVEEQLLEKDVECDLLKVAHHGSRQSNSDKFLRKVKPKIAIISVGKNNDYGFPKKVVLNKLELLGAQIYRTDEVGTIIASSDGNTIEIETKMTDTNGEE